MIFHYKKAQKKHKNCRNISSYWHGDRTKLLDFTFAKFDEELHVDEKAYMSLSVEDLNIIISTLDKQGLVDWERLKKMESKND